MIPVEIYIGTIIGLIGIFFIIAMNYINKIYVNRQILEKEMKTIYNKLYEVLDTITLLDKKQMFEKDDEVGRIWIKIRDTIMSIEEITNDIEEDSE